MVKKNEITNNVYRLSSYFFVLWVYLFSIQDISEKYINISYFDELFALLIIPLFFVWMKKGKMILKKKKLKFIIFPILFIVGGCLGNIIYSYQNLKLILIDVLTNLKFFMAIAASMILFDYKKLYKDRKLIIKNVRLITSVLFLLFLIDRFIPLFGMSEYRYGIRTAILFYKHATYFAGTLVFLLALLTLFFDKNNKKYIILCCIMLVFTLRSKAIVGMIVYVMLYFIVIKLNQNLKKWQIVLVIALCLIMAWSQISFYFVTLNGASARSVMLLTAFKIMKDYFPIGTGFATYASHSASVNYSPVYIKYGFNFIYELRNSDVGTFFDDQFWPIIIGQTGFLGTVGYIMMLGCIIKKVLSVKKVNKYAYMTGIFLFAYLFIASVAEPAFNNSIAIPMAMLIGIIISKKMKGRE